MEATTPLTEVIKHLPKETAEYLFKLPYAKSVQVLCYIRTGIRAMEEKGAQLDPVSYDAVVYGMGLLAIAAVTQEPSSNGGKTL